VVVGTGLGGRGGIVGEAEIRGVGEAEAEVRGVGEAEVRGVGGVVCPSLIPRARGAPTIIAAANPAAPNAIVDRLTVTTVLPWHYSTILFENVL